MPAGPRTHENRRRKRRRTLAGDGRPRVASQYARLNASEKTFSRIDDVAPVEAIQALEALKEPVRVRLHADSAHIVNCFHQRWHERWQRNGWRNSKKEPVENRDLWERILASTKRHQVEFVKVIPPCDLGGLHTALIAAFTCLRRVDSAPLARQGAAVHLKA